MSSFVLDVGESGMHVALVSTHDLEIAERLTKVLRSNGFTVRMMHQPPSVKVQDDKGGGKAND